MNSRLISIKSVFDRIYRRLNVNEDLPEDDMIEWIGEALLKIGAFSQFIPRVKELDITGGKVSLPCDFYKLIEISFTLTDGCGMQYLPFKGESFLNEYFCEDCKIVIRKYPNEESFMINDAYIYTSFNEGKICISYLAMPVDKDGYPMIPDDELTIDACAKYVIYQLDYREWRKSAITDKVFEHSERQWYYGVGAARGSLNMPNTQQLESLRNVLQRLIPSQTFTNSKERKRIQ